MWLETFGNTNWDAYCIFMGSSGLVALLGLLNMLSPYFKSDHNRGADNENGVGLEENRNRRFSKSRLTGHEGAGSSLSFLIGFSSVLISMLPLFYGLNYTWFEPHVYSSICQIFIAPFILGFSMNIACLVSKLMITISLFKKREKARIRGSMKRMKYREWRATVVVLLVVTLASAIVLGWTLVFPATARPIISFSGNRSVISGYECVDAGSTNEEKVARTVDTNSTTMEMTWSKKSSHHSYQLIWRIGSTMFIFILLLIAGFQMPVLVFLEMPAYHLMTTVCYVVITVNGLCTFAACTSLWIMWRDQDADKDRLLLYSVGGLELWHGFISNIMALVATVISTDSDVKVSHKRTSIKRIVGRGRQSIVSGLRGTDTQQSKQRRQTRQQEMQEQTSRPTHRNGPRGNEPDERQGNRVRIEIEQH